MKKSKLLTVVLAVLLALAVLAGAIAVPVLCRPFYYAHIGPLGLCDWGLTEQEIRTAYGEMMDYCLGLRAEFSVGRLAFSASGAEHFADVRRLFLLDMGVLFASLAGLLAVGFVSRKKKLRPYRFAGRGAGFWAAVCLGGSFLLVGGLAALDFDAAFTLFHTLFFPGKTNWIFDWRTDPIILFLPQTFFANCALLILGLLLFWCGLLIALDFKMKPKKPPAPPAGGCAGCSGAAQSGCAGCTGCGPKA